MRLKKQVSLFVVTAGLLNALAPAALASTYDAHCNGRKCRVNVDAGGISTADGFIPMNRVAKWFTGGEESYNMASGTAGTLGAATLGAIGGGLLLGPIGLLGGLIGGGIAGSKAGKGADMYFSVIGYNEQGEKTSLSFNFVNPKPARKLASELAMFSGLGAGQTKSLASLKAALAQESSAPAFLPDRLVPSEEVSVRTEPTAGFLPDNLNDESLASSASSQEEELAEATVFPGDPGWTRE